MFISECDVNAEKSSRLANEDESRTSSRRRLLFGYSPDGSLSADLCLLLSVDMSLDRVRLGVESRHQFITYLFGARAFKLTTTMAMHNIPFDVLEIIVALCDSNGDLLTLSQANRTLQDLAERRLYKNIGALDVSRMCRVLHSVVHSTLPRGTFILDFGVHDSYFNATNPGCQLLGGFYRLLGQALRRMSNLRSLYLHLHPSQAWVINSCTTKLSMIVTNIPAGHLLASWLENQDHLVTFLHADRTPHPTPREFTVSPNAASHLRFIGARGGVLERLVPGRPVICAYLDYTDDFIRGVKDDEERVDYRDVMDALDASAGPLHTLSVHFRPFTEENAQSLVPFFKIESFNLSCVRTFDLHWPNNADYIMDVRYWHSVSPICPDP